MCWIILLPIEYYVEFTKLIHHKHDYCDVNCLVKHVQDNSIFILTLDIDSDRGSGTTSNTVGHITTVLSRIKSGKEIQYFDILNINYYRSLCNILILTGLIGSIIIVFIEKQKPYLKYSFCFLGTLKHFFKRFYYSLLMIFFIIC